jgi:hypothetical protein
MAELAQQSIQDLIRSPFYNKAEPVQVLLSGFDRQEVTIIEVSLYPTEKLSIERKQEGYGAIGSGTPIALVLLSLRECNPSIPMQYGAYLAYEAKRGSEKTGSVGRISALVVQAPPGYNDRDRAWIKI